MFNARRFAATPSDHPNQMERRTSATEYSIPSDLDSWQGMPQAITDAPRSLRKLDPAPASRSLALASEPVPDLNEMALRAMREQIIVREQYARLYLPDANKTDDESQNEQRARAIVLRAIKAMGGRDLLDGLTDMHVRVWVEATEHVRGSFIRNVALYAYPVAQWHFVGSEFTSEPINVTISLDPRHPNLPYVFRNPQMSMMRYGFLFDYRWSMLDRASRQLRERGEFSRWRFQDRFLGEAVALAYLGQEIFDREAVDVILVDDHKFGHYFEAGFSRKNGLLLYVREGLTETEGRAVRARQQKRELGGAQESPVFLTQYREYTEVQGVLTPLYLKRSCARCGMGGASVRANIRLAVGYNGQQPSSEPPVTE
jgi:hypothetical protein